MSKLSVIAVAGAAGVGKTTWITQQFAADQSAVSYYCPKTEPTPIDSTKLAIDFPVVPVLTEERVDQLRQLAMIGTLYIEVGFHLSLATIDPLLNALQAHRVAVIAPGGDNGEWMAWADQTTEGQVLSPTPAQDLWRSPLTSQVLDPASLDVLWYELTHGAYGMVQRAKGIFDLADGRAFYFDFVAEQGSRYQELDLPLWTSGRPERFSGMEVIGVNLERAVIGETLRECCLSTEAIAYCQAQAKEPILEPAG